MKRISIKKFMAMTPEEQKKVYEDLLKEQERLGNLIDEIDAKHQARYNHSGEKCDAKGS